MLSQAPASAIVLLTPGKLQVAGYFEKEEGNQIYVRVKTADGKEEIKMFDRSKITIEHQVDRVKLGRLTKETPKAYRDYAEELAKQTKDPEAMELAIRLYLIAAYLDPANLGRSSLMNMSALAKRPADARKYRAMAFLLDTKGDEGLLKSEVKKALPESKAASKALTEFQKALKAYRNGELAKAKSIANDKNVGDYFAKAGFKDQKSFLQACNDANCAKCKAGKVECATCNGKKTTDPFGMQACATCNGKGTQTCTACDGAGKTPISEDVLRSVLRAELWALEQILPSESASPKNNVGGWSSAVSNPQASIPLLTLETITEFDPRKCVFRNGSWELP